MDPIWILIAFILGFIVKQIGLPPLIGFLIAGFALNYMGVENNETLQKIADFGVLLLLFGIGLKLKVKNLLKPEIWATSSLHMLITVLIFGAIIFGLSALGLSLFKSLSLGTSLIIAFALSFSSTVFAVKILEGQGAMSSTHGKIAIGILIMQDIFAVVFLTVSSGKMPSVWALALLALIFLPRLIKFAPLEAILNRSGHGELLVLLGVLIPIGTAHLFGTVGLKPDLGALTIGVLLANHPKAKELSNAILSFKDLFLVGFFLTIGLMGLPTLESLGISFLFILLLPIKVFLFYVLLTRFKLRANTATLSTFNLANYSEFGLIVGAAGLSAGWIAPEWMVVFALTLSLSFILAAPLNISAHKIFARWQNWLANFERTERLPEDEPIKTGNVQVVIIGMGRTGNEVYKLMQNNYGYNTLGIDHNLELVRKYKKSETNVIHGDADDNEFLQRIIPSHTVQLLILATSKHTVHMEVIKKVKEYNPEFKIAALSRYNDEMDELKDAGADFVFDIYAEAGIGYAQNVYESLCKEL